MYVLAKHKEERQFSSFILHISSRITKTPSEVTVRFTWSWRFTESRELVRTVHLTGPVQQSPSVLHAELWGLCSLDLACSSSLFFVMIFRRRRAIHSLWQLMDRDTFCYHVCNSVLQTPDVAEGYIWQYTPWHKGLCQWHNLDKRYILLYAWLP